MGPRRWRLHCPLAASLARARQLRTIDRTAVARQIITLCLNDSRACGFKMTRWRPVPMVRPGGEGSPPIAARFGVGRPYTSDADQSRAASRCGDQPPALARQFTPRPDARGYIQRVGQGAGGDPCAG